MDSGSTTAPARHKNKPSKRQKPNEGQDIISNLPDFIIGWILSFLPTKDAVRTSVLSKRWEYLWTFITKLHFEIGVQHLLMRKTPKNFENFVNRVLFHLNNLSIQSFSLVIFGFLNHPNLVNDWISAVLNRRVQKLSLCLHSHEFIPLSFRSLLNCESLEELVLNMSWFGIIFHSSFYLPRLKILNLSGTEFESTSGSKELSFSFPVLETFETQDCFWSGTESVIFTVPLLKRVKIGYSKSKNYNLDDCAIKFRASRLTEFTYCGQMIHNIILLDSSAACNSSANFILNLTGSKEETGLRACMLLRQFSQVEFLKLYDEEVLEQAKEALADLPAFEMLRHLELGSVNVEIMLRVLLKSPFLKTLILEDICEFDEELLNSAIVSDCLKSTLKVIKFKGVRGYEHELCLVSFLMENAIVLERMHFAPAWRLRKSDSAMEEFKEKLISFKKGFTFAIIEFLWL